MQDHTGLRSAFQTASLDMADIARDRPDKMSLLFCKRKCGIVPPRRSPSGCEWPSNQALPFTAAGLQRAAGLTSEGPASPLPVLWDPSTSFRGQMRCKSIKREFVCRSQSHWGWEPLPCHSGAANFLLLHTRAWGLPTVLIALGRDPLTQFQVAASCGGGRWFIKPDSERVIAFNVAGFIHTECIVGVNCSQGTIRLHLRISS